MIRTVAGLLDSLKHREVELIAQSGIQHAPTMRSGLFWAQDLNDLIFDNLCRTTRSERDKCQLLL